MSTIYYTINGVDVSQYVLARSFSASKTLSFHASSAYFEIQNPATPPQDGNEVKVYLDTTANMLFAGVLYAITQSSPAPGVYRYALQCADYTRIFDRKLVPEKYVDGTAIQTVIKDIVTKYTSGFTSTHVGATGTLIGDVIFNYRTPSDCIREICEKHGSISWYIDENRDVHAYYSEDETAPYAITDALLGQSVANFRITCDYSQVRNQVMVQGGYTLSDAISVSYNADGTQRQWTLPYFPHNLTVTVGGASKTLGQENVDPDDGTYAYFYNYYEKLVKCATAEATPAAGTVMTFGLKYEVPILVRASDPASIAMVKAAEGGDGIYEYVVKDNTLELMELCMAQARRELLKYAKPKVRGSFSTYLHGFDIGQKLTINATGCLYNGSYSITDLKVESMGNNIVQYVIDFEGNLL